MRVIINKSHLQTKVAGPPQKAHAFPPKQTQNNAIRNPTLATTWSTLQTIILVNLF